MKAFIYFSVVLLMFSCRENIEEPVKTGMENKSIPMFSMLLPDSITYFNTSNLKPDKKIILFYYSANCPYCRAQMRDVLNNIGKFNSEQICVVIDGNYYSMKQFSNYFKLESYPNIITGIDTGYILARNYGIRTVPFTAVFDEQRRLASAYMGMVSSKTLVKAIH